MNITHLKKLYLNFEIFLFFFHSIVSSIALEKFVTLYTLYFFAFLTSKILILSPGFRFVKNDFNFIFICLELQIVFTKVLILNL